MIMKSDISPAVVEQIEMDASPNYLEAIEHFQENSEGIPEILEKFLVHVAKTGDILAPWEKVQKIFIKKMKLVVDDFYSSNPYTAGNVNPNSENDKFEEMRERLLQIVSEFETPPFTFQRLCELVSSPKKGYTKCEKFMRAMEKNLLVVSSWTYPPRRSGESMEQVNGIEMVSTFNNIERPWTNLPPSPMTTSAPKFPDIPAATQDSTNTVTNDDAKKNENNPDTAPKEEDEPTIKESVDKNQPDQTSEESKTEEALPDNVTTNPPSTENLASGDASMPDEAAKETFPGNLPLPCEEEKREPLPSVGTLVEKHSIKSHEIAQGESAKQCADTPDLTVPVSMETNANPVPQSPKRKHSETEDMPMDVQSPTKRIKQDEDHKGDVSMESSASDSNT